MSVAFSRRERLLAYLQLARPANVVTALADVLAGAAAAGAVLGASGLPWLLLSTAGLYGGGVVFNDVFDAELDAQERPERPIPSGRVSRPAAARFGGALLLVGVIAAARVSWASFGLAVAIALGALLYDAWGKHQDLLGPLNMGLCRGGNLLLGVSIAPTMMAERWFLALIPIIYIAAITAISRGEVHGGDRRTSVAALFFVGVIIAVLLVLGVEASYSALTALPFVGFFAGLVLPAFVRAARTLRAEHIRTAVKFGVLALIPLNAALAAGYAGWVTGLVVLVLLPVSMGLGRAFAVT